MFEVLGLFAAAFCFEALELLEELLEPLELTDGTGRFAEPEFAAGFWEPPVWRSAWLLRAEAETCLVPCLGPGGGRLFADLIITNRSVLTV